MSNAIQQHKFKLPDPRLYPSGTFFRRKLAESGWIFSSNHLMLAQAFAGQIIRGTLQIHLWKTHDWLQEILQAKDFRAAQGVGKYL